MTRTFFFLGALFGGLGVALGAFAAHALKERLPPGMLAVFETGVRYQLFHAFALLAAALAWAQWGHPAAKAAGWCFAGGIVLFSGSLYVLALSGVRWIGAITPVGGVAFLAGWALLAWAALRS